MHIDLCTLFIQISTITSAVLFGCIALPDGMGERCFDRVAAAGGYLQVVQSLVSVLTTLLPLNWALILN